MSTVAINNSFQTQRDQELLVRNLTGTFAPKKRGLLARGAGGVAGTLGGAAKGVVGGAAKGGAIGTLGGAALGAVGGPAGAALGAGVGGAAGALGGAAVGGIKGAIKGGMHGARKFKKPKVVYNKEAQMPVKMVINNGEQARANRRLLLNNLEYSTQPVEMVHNSSLFLKSAGKGLRRAGLAMRKAAKSSTAKKLDQAASKGLGKAKEYGAKVKEFAKTRQGKMTMAGGAVGGAAAGGYQFGKRRKG